MCMSVCLPLSVLCVCVVPYSGKHYGLLGVDEVLRP